LRSIFAVVDLHAGRVVVALYNAVRYAADLFGCLIVSSAHKPLDGRNGLFGVGNGLALSRVTYLTFTILHECHNRRRGPLAFVVGDDYRLITLHHSNARVGSS